jgi:hypothetical protein
MHHPVVILVLPWIRMSCHDNRVASTRRLDLRASDPRMRGFRSVYAVQASTLEVITEWIRPGGRMPLSNRSVDGVAPGARTR